MWSLGTLSGSANFTISGQVLTVNNRYIRQTFKAFVESSMETVLGTFGWSLLDPMEHWTEVLISLLAVKFSRWATDVSGRPSQLIVESGATKLVDSSGWSSPAPRLNFEMLISSSVVKFSLWETGMYLRQIFVTDCSIWHGKKSPTAGYLTQFLLNFERKCKCHRFEFGLHEPSWVG